MGNDRPMSEASGHRASRLRTALAVLVVAAVASALSLAGVAPSAAAATSSSAAQQLADKYAPLVVIRQHQVACGDGEPYLPTPVETVLGNADVVLRGPGGESIAAPTAADLAGKGEGWYLDLPGNPLDPGCTYETWFDQASAGRQPTVYARIGTDPDHPDQLALQYWFFWTYNDWNDKHEGDWEMIQLLFDAKTPEEALTQAPTSTAFAQHEGSETSDWTDEKLLKQGDHLVVYPGQGSHAAYYTQAQWFGKSAAAGFGCDSTQAAGSLVTPTVVLVPDDPTGDFGWLTFTGRWGQKAPSFNNGPTGPNTKTQWTHPVTWQVEEGRAGAVALPVVGGPAVESFCALTETGSLLFIKILDRPILVIVLVVSLMALIVALVIATAWRHGDDHQPDRERQAGQVVTASFELLWRNILGLWPIIVVIGLSSAAALALQRLALHRRPSDDLTDVNGIANRPLALLLVIIISIALAPVIAVLLTATSRVIENIARGRRPEPWQAMALAVRRPTGALVQLSLYIVVTAFASSLYLLPVALVLISFFAVSMPAAVVEEIGFIAAFKRSAKLTNGRHWRAIFLSALLVWIGFSLPGAIGGIVLLVTGWPFWVTNVVVIVLSAILLPFSAIGLTLQFYDFRQEETRDAALARAEAPA
jgi:hypothetical protein